MLAQSFMTAAQLNITDAQYDALKKTLVWFETGKSVHTKLEYRGRRRIGSDAPHRFNLALWIAEYDCGTVACIGGTASLLGKVSFDGWVNHAGLTNLFNPNILKQNVTVEQAAQALRNFLQTGHAGWGRVIRNRTAQWRKYSRPLSAVNIVA